MAEEKVPQIVLDIHKTLERVGNVAPLGECSTCDGMRGQDMHVPFPWHRALTPGHRNHCSCDRCF